MSNSATPWTVACQAPLSSTISQSLLKFMFIESLMLSNHLILCCPFSFCRQSFPASDSFSMSRLFASSGQSIGASASVLPMNIQGWFPSGLTGLISLLPTGLLGVFCRLAVQIANETIHVEHSVQCLLLIRRKEMEGRRKEGKKKHDFSTHFYYLSLLFIRSLRKICLLLSDVVRKRHCSLPVNLRPASLLLTTHPPTAHTALCPSGPCYPSELLKLLLERHSRQIWILHKAKPAWSLFQPHPMLFRAYSFYRDIVSPGRNKAQGFVSYRVVLL